VEARSNFENAPLIIVISRQSSRVEMIIVF
jgi:hypothetical protein